MPSIEGIINVLGNIGSDVLAVHEQRCVAVRNQHADCLKCAFACTTGALTYSENSLVVDPAKCIGCGTCATVCPTCALEILDPDDAALTAEAKDALAAAQGHAVIACEKMLNAFQGYSVSQLGSLEKMRHATDFAYDPEQICCVKCLGRVDESLLCGLVAYGAKSITLVHYACKDCEHAPGGATAQRVVESANNLLSAFGATVQVQLAKRLPSHCQGWHSAHEQQAKGRRAFFSEVRETSEQVAAAAIGLDAEHATQAEESEFVPPAYAKVGKDGTLEQFVPERRIRTVNYLQHVGEPVVDKIDSRIIGSITIDGDACTSCRMCATFCPTGAIRKLGEGIPHYDMGAPDKAQPEFVEEEADFFGILHRPTLCVQCRLCENICPEEAISISSTVSTGQFMGKKAQAIQMKRPTWEGNRPDSMFRKVRHIIGADDLHMIQF